MTKADMVAVVKLSAAAAQLDEAVMCAVAEQESEWNPWAYRYEPAFYTKYVAPQKLSPTESYGRSTSWGLLQTMGQSIRELGYAGDLPALCDPATGVEWGCKLFVVKLGHAGGNYDEALQLWNGGSNPNYAAQVMARVANYS
jgi:soluble lytic murein transglycosylase-like protein